MAGNRDEAVRSRAFFIVTIGIVVGAGHSGAARADDVSCGSSPAAVNIPGGSLALQASANGPISTVIQAAGETRTHSLLVHGNGYVTHAAMKQPSQVGTFSCDSPVDPGQLQYGYPGMEQIDMGALYAFTYGQSGPAQGQVATTSGTVEFFYQGGNGDGANRGQAVADWAWNNLPYWDIGNGTYRIGFYGASSPGNYVLYQFKDMQGINQGAIPPWNGSVCSTTIAYAQFMSGNGVIDNANTYPHAAVTNALSALHDVVSASCNNGLGFWDSVLAGSFGAISCMRNSDSKTCVFGFCFYTPQFPSVCTLAADQVDNCFATGQCATSDQHQWQAVRDNPNETATSISPDNLGGWGSHGWGPAAPYSVWSWDNANAVYWSSPGNVYGCWM
jgi:hypothetical protein